VSPTEKEAREALARLTRGFTAGFNRDDLDAVMSYFAEDAVYDEFDGRRHVGIDAIRAAFVPQFRGDFGRIRFHEEDLFVEPAAGRALISWTCTLERAGKTHAWRGLDVLHVRDGRIVVKETYAKAERPKTEAR
jgi:uncharacterized protein (TIGR02246 family)